MRILDLQFLEIPKRPKYLKGQAGNTISIQEPESVQVQN